MSEAQELQKSVVLVKPSMYYSFPEVIDELSREIKWRGLQILEEWAVQLSEEFVKSHYANIADKPYFGEVIEDMTLGPVYKLIIEWRNAVAECIDLVGSETDPTLCAPSSFRKRHWVSRRHNGFHRSAVGDAKWEVVRFEWLN